MILHARHRKLKKGTGFHLDLLLAGNIIRSFIYKKNFKINMLIIYIS